MVGCGMKTEGFLIFLELCIVYFALEYAAVFDPAAGFQARSLLVSRQLGFVSYNLLATAILFKSYF